MIRAHMVLVLSVLAGCTETIRLQNDSLENLIALDITPGGMVLTLTDLGPQPVTLQYHATGHFLDGSSRDVTNLVHWSIDKPLIGAIDAHGLFSASHRAAGYAMITIDGRDISISADLTVKIDATIVDGSFPPPSAGLFDPSFPVIGGEPTKSPTMIYPADGTLFPQGVSRTLYQYLRGAGNDAFQLTFSSSVLHLVVETGADRWEANGLLQEVVAGTGIVEPIRVEIRATYSAGTGVIYAGNHVILSFAEDQPLTPLYYWSSATNGIMRGGLDVVAASKLYPGSTTCVGCHTVTRDGRQLAMSYDDAVSFDLHTIDASTLSTRIGANTARPMGWATYSPTGDLLVVANNGVLTLYDALTGSPRGVVPLPSMRYATHPDWSPDGSSIAVALTSTSPTNMDVKAASIARIPYNGGAWGAPQVLVSGATTNNNYFPKWSPDGKYLMYVHATATSQGATSAELMLVPAAGGTPTRLRIASHRVGTQDDVPDLSNSMPTWWPDVGQRAWIAFVSARAYGAVRPSVGGGQIWVSAIDLRGAGDPSSAAFWLPCQDVTVLNNNPSWAGNVIPL